jgi:hypothetical protein
MPVWQPRDGGRLGCERHGEVFERTSGCTGCLADPGAFDALIEPVSTDKDLDLLETELRTEARFYRKLGREKCDGSDRDCSLGLKAAEISLKFDRAYKEILTERKGREHDRWLVEQNRLLQGSGTS